MLNFLLIYLIFLLFSFFKNTVQNSFGCNALVTAINYCDLKKWFTQK